MKSIFISISKNNLIKVNLSDILFIQSDKDYIHIQQKEKIRNQVSSRITLYYTLKRFIEKLCTENSNFVHVHKSYIVNTENIDEMKSNENSDLKLYMQNHIVPVSDPNKQNLYKKLNIITRKDHPKY